MALTTTTLTAAINSSKLANIALTSTTGFAANQPVMIDGEIMWCVTVNPNFGITVRSRGADGTAAVSHDVLAPVVTGLTTDFPTIAAGQVSVQPPNDDQVLSIGQDQTITLPNENVVYYITKGSPCVITLAAATGPTIGVQATFISNSAFAHTITYALGFRGGVNTVATFTNTVGSSMMVQVGVGGQIAVLSLNNVTLSA